MIWKKPVPLQPKSNNNKNRTKMEILTEQEMQRVLGGGYWIYLTEQGWIYIDENDEENDDTDIIYVG